MTKYFSIRLLFIKSLLKSHCYLQRHCSEHHFFSLFFVLIFLVYLRWFYGWELYSAAVFYIPLALGRLLGLGIFPEPMLFAEFLVEVILRLNVISNLLLCESANPALRSISSVSSSESPNAIAKAMAVSVTSRLVTSLLPILKLVAERGDRMLTEMIGKERDAGISAFHAADHFCVFEVIFLGRTYGIRSDMVKI